MRNMGMREVENKIIEEAKGLLANPKLKLKDLLEWSTGEAAVKKNLQAGEAAWIAVKTELNKRA
jgi:hypothetical protein